MILASGRRGVSSIYSRKEEDIYFLRTVKCSLMGLQLQVGALDYLRTETGPASEHHSGIIQLQGKKGMTKVVSFNVFLTYYVQRWSALENARTF